MNGGAMDFAFSIAFTKFCQRLNTFGDTGLCRWKAPGIAVTGNIEQYLAHLCQTTQHQKMQNAPSLTPTIGTFQKSLSGSSINGG